MKKSVSSFEFAWRTLVVICFGAVIGQVLTLVGDWSCTDAHIITTWDALELILFMFGSWAMLESVFWMFGFVSRVVRGDYFDLEAKPDNE